jgi:tetratricopeptide (TPR) repeat protein
MFEIKESLSPKGLNKIVLIICCLLLAGSPVYAQNKNAGGLNAAQWMEEGNTAYKSGKLHDAVMAYTNSINLEPRAKAYCNRGVAYYRLRDYKKAIDSFNKAIELDPKNADAYYNRGRAHGHLGNYRQAIEDNTAAIGLNPQDRDAYNNRGIAYRKMGKNSKAIADLKTAAKMGSAEARDYLKKKKIAW